MSNSYIEYLEHRGQSVGFSPGAVTDAFGLNEKLASTDAAGITESDAYLHGILFKAAELGVDPVELFEKDAQLGAGLWNKFRGQESLLGKGFAGLKGGVQGFFNPNSSFTQGAQQGAQNYSQQKQLRRNLGSAQLGATGAKFKQNLVAHHPLSQAFNYARGAVAGGGSHAGGLQSMQAANAANQQGVANAQAAVSNAQTAYNQARVGPAAAQPAAAQPAAAQPAAANPAVSRRSAYDLNGQPTAGS